jgi:hypothetical protein
LFPLKKVIKSRFREIPPLPQNPTPSTSIWKLDKLIDCLTNRINSDVMLCLKILTHLFSFILKYWHKADRNNTTRRPSNPLGGLVQRPVLQVLLRPQPTTDTSCQPDGEPSWTWTFSDSLTVQDAKQCQRTNHLNSRTLFTFHTEKKSKWLLLF